MKHIFDFSFIGCGEIAKYHADVILSLGHNISSVSSRPNSKNIQSFSKKYKIRKQYDDFHRMISSESNIDAIILCTPWDQTQNIIYDVACYSIPVLVEKPISLDSVNLKNTIYKLGDLANNILVAYNRRFYDFIHLLKNEIQINKLLSVQVNCPENSKYLLDKYFNMNNNIIKYMTSHWLDLLFYLNGKIEIDKIYKNINKKGFIYSYNGLLKFVNCNTPVHYQSNYNNPQNVSLSFSFIDSYWLLSPVEILSIYKKLELIHPTKDYPIRKYVPKLDKRIHTNLEYKPGFYSQMIYFIEKYILKKKIRDSLDAKLMKL